MLFVVMNHKTASEKEITWHTGSKLNLKSTDLVDVDFVQADGHELEFLKTSFPKVRFSNKRVESFSGQEAMEVAALLLAKV